MNHGAAQSHDAEYVSTAELCHRLGISRSTVYRRGLHAFALPIGGVWRFKWADIVRHFENEKRRMATLSNAER